jgi:predicted nuclease of predicted toxin-antitoxin system
LLFIIDAQLPPALAPWLIAKGHQAVHVADIGMNEAEDNAIWLHALALGAVILSKDEDFASRAIQGQGAPTIVWLRVGNCSNQALRAWFEPLLPDVLRQIQQGERLIEVR